MHLILHGFVMYVVQTDLNSVHNNSPDPDYENEDVLPVPRRQRGQPEYGYAHDQVEQVCHGQRDQQLDERTRLLVPSQAEHREHIPDASENKKT